MILALMISDEMGSRPAARGLEIYLCLPSALPMLWCLFTLPRQPRKEKACHERLVRNLHQKALPGFPERAFHEPRSEGVIEVFGFMGEWW